MRDARRVIIPLNLAPAGMEQKAPGATVQMVGGRTMGTSWSVRAVMPAGTSLESHRPGIEGELDLVIRQMSTWEPGSALSRFNQAPAGSWRPLPRELMQVLDCGMGLAAETKGAFDPAAGALVNLWGFGPEPARQLPPTEPAITEALAVSSWQRVRLDPAGCRALQPGGVYLDLSGIAKGHAVDRVTACLEAGGIASYLVEIGGELRGRGVKPDMTPWWVGLEAQVPTVGDSAPVLIALHGLSVASSGDHQRVFEAAGRRYSHTIDPRTGYPVDGSLSSVTVLDESCMRADALATAILVLGEEAGQAYAAARGIPSLFGLRGLPASQWPMSPALAAMVE